MGFIHLHRHSEFSILDGTGTAKQYAERAAELDQPALALTDHGTLSGALHHIDACEKAGILPIAGVEAYFKSDRADQDEKPGHIVLLAKNLAGWESLLRITSEAWLTGLHKKGWQKRPCVDWNLLVQHNEGLICGTACVSGPVCRALREGMSGTHELKQLREIFGEDLFVEIMPHAFEIQQKFNVGLVSVADELSIPVVATVDAHYPYKEWADTQDVVLMMATNQSLEKRKAKKEAGEDVYEFGEKTLYLMDSKDCAGLFAKHHPEMRERAGEAMKNAGWIVERIEPFHIDRTDKMPKVPGGTKVAKDLLDSWIAEGLVRIGKTDDEEYLSRVAHEMRVFEDMEVLDYFVLVGDAVRWAKAQGIRIGAGRGSAAGCLVSYLIGITGIDPLRYGLLFERFLNPHRKELPDIDIDFQHDRRDDVKAYLATKYGQDRVADIIAHGTFAPKASLKDVARVHDVPYEIINSVLKTMDDIGDDDLDTIRLTNEKLDKFANDWPEVWKHAKRIEGQIRSIGKHAAGVIVTNGPVTDHMPTQVNKDGTIVTAWSERTEFPIITEFGFVKIDVLSTDGLTKQARCIELVKERSGVDIDIDDLPASHDPRDVDQDVMQGFRDGNTLGVFQFESSGITGLLKQIKPDHVFDLCAANALYRPGPLQGGITFQYGDIKNGKLPLEIPHPSVDPILGETYGLIAYQEQVMQVVQALGGFSMAEADTIRKSITKWYKHKGGTVLRTYKKKFFAGCLERGLDDEAADAIWSKILKFAQYGFNKSHSAGYAYQAYQDMWLKTKHPLEFYAAQLTYEDKKIPKLVREARTNGIKILPPDVNASTRGFGVDGDAIRYGLDAIKNVGDKAVDVIVGERDAKGEYASYQDFMDRIPKRQANRRVRQALEEAGAFDTLGCRADLGPQQKGVLEKALLGITLSDESGVMAHKNLIMDRIWTEAEVLEAHDGDVVVIGGEFTEIKEILTKRGAQMASGELAMGANAYAVTLFPREWKRFRQIVDGGRAVLVRGKKDDWGKIVIDDICIADDLANEIESNGGTV